MQLASYTLLSLLLIWLSNFLTVAVLLLFPYMKENLWWRADTWSNRSWISLQWPSYLYQLSWLNLTFVSIPQVIQHHRFFFKLTPLSIDIDVSIWRVTRRSCLSILKLTSTSFFTIISYVHLLVSFVNNFVFLSCYLLLSSVISYRRQNLLD